jgi:hypothetical protein
MVFKMILPQFSVKDPENQIINLSKTIIYTMRKLTKNWAIVLLCTMLTLTVCQTTNEDVMPDDDDNQQVDDKPDDPVDDPKQEGPTANDISKLLKFTNAIEFSGNIPLPGVNANLKIDKDTIFLVEGLQTRIRILFPDKKETECRSFIQIVGAEKYYDVTHLIEQVTDSTCAFSIELDVSKIDADFPFTHEQMESYLPAKFKIKIVPHDQNGVPIGTIEKDLIIEKKGEGLCSPFSPSENWFWQWTIREGEIIAAPGYINATTGTTNGCCVDGETVDCIANAIPKDKYKSLTYQSYHAANYEYLSFKSDGTILGQLGTKTQNINYGESNFCSGDAAYNTNVKDHIFWGNYTFNPSSSIINFTSLESRSVEVYLPEINMSVTEYDQIYISEMFEYEMVSCHYLIERSSIEGMVRERLFERKGGIVDAKNPWYD